MADPIVYYKGVFLFVRNNSTFNVKQFLYCDKKDKLFQKATDTGGV